MSDVKKKPWETARFVTVPDSPRKLKPGQVPKVFLHCSFCDKRLKRMGPRQKVAINRGYFCVDCQIDVGLEMATGPK